MKRLITKWITEQGFFWDIGIGLAIGLNCLAGWGIYAVGWALFMTFIGVVFPRDHYENYKVLLVFGGGNPNKFFYSVMLFIQNLLIIGAAAIVVFIFRFSGKT